MKPKHSSKPSHHRANRNARPGGRPMHHGGKGRRPFSPSRRGPQTCPMCGAVVSDLAGHIRSKHDDPASHPRD